METEMIWASNPDALGVMADFFTIDPGVHASGFAGWSKNGILTMVGYGKLNTGIYGKALIEFPVIYPGMQKGNPNDLLNLAFSVGVLSTFFVDFSPVKPRQWKGTIKKEIMLKRIVSKLTEEERACAEKLKLPKSKQKEVIDAIGIGLWHFKRL